MNSKIYHSDRAYFVQDSMFNVDTATFPFQPTVIYCDPPWNQVVLNQFYKRATIPTIPTFPDWLVKFIHYLRDTTANLFIIEMGLPNLILLETAAKPYFNLIAQHTDLYGSPEKPSQFCVSFYARKQNPTTFTPILPQEQQFSMKGPELYIPQLPPDTILFDPCMGNGHYPALALKNNFRTIGIEIVEPKFNRAIQMASKYTKLTKD